MSKRVLDREQVVLSATLSEQVRAGVSLAEAARRILPTTKNPNSRALLELFSQCDSEEGLDGTFESLSRLIGEGNAGLIATGHRFGRLPDALSAWGDLSQKEGPLRAKWTGPLVAFYAVSGIWYVSLELFLRSVGGLISAENMILAQTPFYISRLLMVALILVTSFLVYLYVVPRWPSMHARLEKVFWQVPRLGLALRISDKVRVLRMLSWAAESGTVASESFGLIQASAKSPRFKKELADAQVRLQRGENYAQSLKDCSLFGPVEIGAMVIAEESGQLPRTLLSLTEDAEAELARMSERTQKGLTLLGPFLLLMPLVFLLLFGLLRG